MSEKLEDRLDLNFVYFQQNMDKCMSLALTNRNVADFLFYFTYFMDMLHLLSYHNHERLRNNARLVSVGLCY